jgi:multiple sugar transport system substrate-binding protein
MTRQALFIRTTAIRTKAAFGAVMIATLALAACSSSNGGGTTSPTPAPATTTPATTAPAPPPTSAEPTTPAAWDPNAEDVNLEIAWWGNDARATLFGQVIDAFTAKYPKIHVTGTPYGSPDDLFNRLATDFGGGGATAPDVFALGGAKPQEYGANGLLLQLDAGDDVSSIANSSMYPDFSLTNAIVDKKLYGLPTGGNATAAFLNTKLFAAAGEPLPADNWTWADMIKAANNIGAKKLTADDGKPVMGVDMRIQDILGTYVGQETQYGMYDWDGNVAVGSDVIAKWYQNELDLQSGGGLPDASVVTANWNLPSDQQPYSLGEAAITFGYSNLVNGPYGLDGATKIMKPPTDTQQSGVALLPSAFWSINAATKAPQAAALLMNWFLSPDAASLIQDTRGVPFRADTAAAVVPTLTGGAKDAAAYVQSVLDSGTVAPPQPNGGANMNQYSQNHESDVLFGKATAQQAADSWVSDLTADIKAAKG